MPWIKEEDCNYCGTCAEECPADAILIGNDKALIIMDNCIRCGTCHSVCPEGAVRHDSEKIPELVEANITMTKKYMDLCASYLGSNKEKEKCLQRMKKHFNKEKIVAEKTIEMLETLKV